jgi:ABC-type polysaccharide transport system permease subunit
MTSRMSWWKKVKKYRALLIMLLPGVVYLIINN